MQFLVLFPDGSRAVKGHPGWLVGETPETSRLLTADELVDAGFGLKLVDEPPAYNPATQTRATSPVSEWALTNRTATVSYVVTDLTAEEIREAMPALTPRQLCLVLPSLGLSEAMIEAKIAAIADPTDRTYADIEWRRATYFKRSHWLVMQIAEDLQLPPSQMDDLWMMAATL